MKIVDLSLTLENNRAWAPWWARTKVQNRDHRVGRRVIRWMLGVPAKLLTTGLGWADDTITLSTHGTTHVDAPWHYGPQCDGQAAKTIDEMPLETFHGPGVVVDIRHLESVAAASVEDVQHGLQKAQHTLTAGDVVLMQTGNDRFARDRQYFSRGPGVSAEATEWLIDQGVKLMGIDAWGWDAPLYHQAKIAKETNDPNVFWAAHYVGTRKEYCHMERLANLAALPLTGFQVCAFPLKVAGGSAGPARIVAMLD